MRTDRPSYLFVLNWALDRPGGVNEAVFGLAREIGMASPDYDPIVAIAGWDQHPTPPHVRNTQAVSLRVRDPLEGGWGVFLAALATMPRDAWTLCRFLRQRRVEVVNAHFPSAGVYLFLLLRRLGWYRGQVILSFHGSDVARLSRLRGFRRRVWSYIISSADIVVTCSRDLGRKVLDLVPSASVVPIHNGADLIGFETPAARTGPRRSLLHIGKFELNKGQDILLRAFQRLLETIPEARLTLIGSDGPDRKRIEALIAELGLGTSVDMFCNVPHKEVPAFLGRADLFVLPSRAEAFGIVLLEAGAAGLPVIATDVGGVPELIEDGVTGLLIPPEDEIRLEAAMRDLLLNTEKADRLAKTWHARSLNGWSWQRAAGEYLAAVRGENERSSCE